MSQYVVDFSDGLSAAAKFIAMEADFGRDGAIAFVAHRKVIDWGAVKAQMLFLHGCIKLKRDARSA